jgi:hypothetical protein
MHGVTIGSCLVGDVWFSRGVLHVNDGDDELWSGCGKT